MAASCENIFAAAKAGKRSQSDLYRDICLNPDYKAVIDLMNEYIVKADGDGLSSVTFCSYVGGGSILVKGPHGYQFGGPMVSLTQMNPRTYIPPESMSDVTKRIHYLHMDSLLQGKLDRYFTRCGHKVIIKHVGDTTSFPDRVLEFTIKFNVRR